MVPRGDNDYHLVVLWPKKLKNFEEHLQRLKEASDLRKDRLFVIEVADPFNIKLVGMSEDCVISWYSSCTMDNLFYALEHYKVYFTSYANPLIDS